MKEVKVVIIATIITVLILVSTACALPAKAESDRGEFYPRLAVVVGYERIGDTDEWIIDCMDKDGQVYVSCWDMVGAMRAYQANVIALLKDEQQRNFTTALCEEIYKMIIL